MWRLRLPCSLSGGFHGVGAADLMGAAALIQRGVFGQFANKAALGAETFACAIGEEYCGTLDNLLETCRSFRHVHASATGCLLAAPASNVTRQRREARFARGSRRMSSVSPPS